MLAPVFSHRDRCNISCKDLSCAGHNNVLKGQVLSPVKVCEESEVATNIQLYETKQTSFTIKLYLKNDTALTNTFIVIIVIISSLIYRLHSELREAEKSLGV